jgi:hypothetical protein
MEAVLERENLKKALAQVKRNRGASGAEGMTVGDLPAHLQEHWLTIRGQLLEGTCKPQPARRVEIPKASGACGRVCRDAEHPRALRGRCRAMRRRLGRRAAERDDSSAVKCRENF